MSDILSLNCLVIGDDLKRMFTVKIARSGSVSTLEKAIKDENQRTFGRVDIIRLELFRTSEKVAGWSDDDDDGLTQALCDEEHSPLFSWRTLSDVFNHPLAPRGIHVLVAPPSTFAASSALQATISLNCLVLGDSRDHIFPVEISSSKTVGALREAIKDKKQYTFHHVEADKLFNFDEPLRATSILAKVFTDPPLEEHLHIVVQPPHEVLENAGIDEGYKDILMELYDSFNRTIMPMKKPPSEMAKSMQYIANQGGKSRILDCRCVDKGPATVVPPIQLFNPVFAYFTSRAFDPEHNVPSVFVRRIRTAVELFAQIHSSEASRQTSLRSILQDIISFPIFFASNADGTSADGVVFGSHGRTECTYLVVVEEKRELGDGWSDPSTQGAFSYLRTFCRPNNSTLLLKTCCPAFIVAHAGPWLNSWFLYTPPMMTTSGYALPVFFMCSRSLLDAYNHGMKTTWRRFTTLRILFPTLGSFPPSICSQRQPLEFDDTCVTYLAETKEICPRKIVVKFVTTYGVDAHKTLADASFAPKLHYFGPIGTDENAVLLGNLKMVVMDYIEGLTLSDALKQHKVPPSFVTHLRQAIAQLHGAGLVFGDLRAPNIMVTPNDKVTVRLIDFDWAGKDGEVVYPVSISSQIDWPTGVEGLMPIERRHDLSNLARIVADVERDTAMEVCMYSKSDGVYQPWHLSPNTHCNGGLKNAVDSAKDRLSWRLWVSTLGSNTYSFGSGMRIIIDKRMREMCGNAPVWIPDGKLESCYDEYCHQASLFVYIAVLRGFLYTLEILWPCLHYAIPDAPKTKYFYDNASFKQYRSVNQHFAYVIVENYHEGDITGTCSLGK
ncbi:hypothetical protein EV401DRAFT_2204424 [Pisolithus croceorrhizus]|nr:hypothetical protein EV401DRAFT_2204424 [Pisolithus croceorrhizus]